MSIVDSPIGPITVIADEDSLRQIKFPDEHKRGTIDDGVETVPARSHRILAVTAQQLDEYFSLEREDFDVPTRFIVGTDFERQVWQQLSTIPFGETMSYGEQAVAVGRPGGAQAVGAANGRNPLPLVLPCHRVIGADGSLVGFGGGVATKQWLLDHERGTQRLFDL